MPERLRWSWILHLVASVALVAIVFCPQESFSATQLFTSQAAFDAVTGAEALTFPASADTAYPDKPFDNGTTLLDYSCIKTPPGISLPFGAAIPKVTVKAPDAIEPDKWICFIGPGWNAGPANIDPTPVSPTIVANGEDNYELLFTPPVYAVGFELLTNYAAAEAITLTYVDLSTKDFSGAVLNTLPNRFEFVGFKSLKPIVKVRIATLNGAVQNEGVVSVKTAEFFKVLIDIKPCSFPNSINLRSKGVIPVAILSTHHFDATKVNPRTALLAGVPPKMWSYEDVGSECHRDDGRQDLMLHYSTEAIADALKALPSLPTRLELTGLTYRGDPIKGSDSIRIVPSNR